MSEQTKKITKKTTSLEDVELNLNETLDVSENTGKKVLKKRTISIEPYFNSGTEFMGYENYGYSAFPGGSETQNLGYIEISKEKYRFLTGLDPQAKSIQAIKDVDERNAVISEIEKTLNWLEERGYNKEMLNPFNKDFWLKRDQKFENNLRIDLDFNDPEHVILYWNIMGGGFDTVAPNLEAAKKSNKLYKWYIAELETEAINKVEIKIIKNEAKELLNKTYKSKPRLLFYVAKNILSPDNFFKNSTPIEIIYDKLDDFIEGKSLVFNKKNAPITFTETFNKSQADLMLMALVRDAIFFRILKQRKDGIFVNPETGSILGKNEYEMFEHLKNPLFASDYDEIERAVKEKWEN